MGRVDKEGCFGYIGQEEINETVTENDKEHCNYIADDSLSDSLLRYFKDRKSCSGGDNEPFWNYGRSIC